MKKILLEEATAEELRQFGVIILGLELSGKENRPTMLAKLVAGGYNAKFINLPNADVTPTAVSRDGAFNTRVNDRGDEEVRILIGRQDKPGGEEPVPVSVNGRAMWIPRGEPAWVPRSYVEVLNHAVEYIYAPYNPDIDDGRGGLQEPRAVLSYPFSYA